MVSRCVTRRIDAVRGHQGQCAAVWVSAFVCRGEASREYIQHDCRHRFDNLFLRPAIITVATADSSCYSVERTQPVAELVSFQQNIE